MGLVAVGWVLLLPAESVALTFEEALAHAYETNPQLRAGRQGLHVTNEEYPTALSGWLPSISVNSSAGRTISETDSDGITGTITQTFNNGISLSQTLFRGGQNWTALFRAKISINNSRVGLFKTEQTTLLSAVTAYMNLIRDDTIRDVRAKNAEALRKRLETVQIQFNLEQRTQTDLSQAKSRLANAEASLTSAVTTLNTSEANFKRIIGLDPKDLVFPSGFSDLPVDINAATKFALQENLDVQLAEFQVELARKDIEAANRERLPTLSISTSFNRNRTGTRGEETADSTEETVAGTINVTVPIFQTGTEFSKVRAARKTLAQRIEQLDNARLVSTEGVVQTWGNLESARARVKSFYKEVDAAKTARKNIEIELGIGRRTVLDLLDAEKEVFDAEVNLVTARRDVIVFSYGLLGALGRLNAKTLNLPVILYDPTQDFERNKFNFFSTSVK